MLYGIKTSESIGIDSVVSLCNQNIISNFSISVDKVNAACTYQTAWQVFLSLFPPQTQKEKAQFQWGSDIFAEIIDKNAENKYNASWEGLDQADNRECRNYAASDVSQMPKFFRRKEDCAMKKKSIWLMLFMDC